MLIKYDIVSDIETNGVVISVIQVALAGSFFLIFSLNLQGRNSPCSFAQRSFCLLIKVENEKCLPSTLRGVRAVKLLPFDF